MAQPDLAVSSSSILPRQMSVAEQSEVEKIASLGLARLLSVQETRKLSFQDVLQKPLERAIEVERKVAAFERQKSAYCPIGLARLRSVEEKRNKSSITDIFSNKEILEAVNKFQLYKDSKDFVDSPLTGAAETVLSHFWNDVDKNDPDSVRAFVEKFFAPPGSELVRSEPHDWKPAPSAITNLTDDSYRQWGLKLNEFWKDLCRKMKDEVDECPDRYSLIYVPNSLIVPGGRFREFYYWDSYWIIKGLLLSEMFDTARDMIMNFVYLVRKYGFIPNGGRTYLLNRSQPPFLIPMVYDYFKATNDEEFVREVMTTLHEESQWWINNRSIMINFESTGKEYRLFQYRASLRSPRPESYKEDTHTASSLATQAEKETLYQSLASACESGWDFSSRWLADGLNLHSCITTQIIPVDLNAIMCWNSRLLSEMHRTLGDDTDAAVYELRWTEMLENFNEVFWDEELGCWFDYWLHGNKRGTKFYGSATVPIYARCYKDVNQVSRAYDFILKSGALSGGGLATSLSESGEQWDFPNAWAPLVHMLVIGLKQTEFEVLEAAADSIAKQWLAKNYETFSDTGDMYEKYKVSSNEVASGGEYEVQKGFGWTNGVVLDLLSVFFGQKDLGDADLSDLGRSLSGILSKEKASANEPEVADDSLFIDSVLHQISEEDEE